VAAKQWTEQAATARAEAAIKEKVHNGLREDFSKLFSDFEAKCAEIAKAHERIKFLEDVALRISMDGEKYQREQAERWHQEFDQMCGIRDDLYAERDYDEEMLAKQRERLIAATEIRRLAESLSVRVLDEYEQAACQVDGHILGIAVRASARRQSRTKIFLARALKRRLDAFQVDFMMGMGPLPAERK
jgi:hypothetical protein